MMYRTAYTQEEWDAIVNDNYNEWDHDVFPHCDQTIFHTTGVCPFCDGYYRRHPTFVPAATVPAEANGWGGNMAPKLDAKAAIEETQALEEFVSKMKDAVRDTRVENERWAERARNIIAKFTKGHRNG